MPPKTRLVWKVNNLSERAHAIVPMLNQVISATLRYEATRLQNHMRTEAPWHDRTSNARNGLFGTYVRDGKTHRIVLYHTMPYGIWLEVRHDGRFAVIIPTLRAKAPEVMASMRRILSAGAWKGPS